MTSLRVLMLIFGSAISLFCGLVTAEPVETETPDVTAELLELRQQGGVLRLAVQYKNNGSKEASVGRYSAGAITLVDVKSKQKHLALKDANGNFIAGPIGDHLDGGRIVVDIPPGGHFIAWAYFEPLAAGTRVSVELPAMFPFEDVPVTEGAGTLMSATTARSTPTGAVATLVSANRANEAVKVRAKLAAEPATKPDLSSPYFNYEQVYLFDPASQRKYPLLKDSEGMFQAQPLTVAIDGGRFILDFDKTTLMSLTFQAPPDNVQTVDLVLPQFVPFEGLAIAGTGGATAGGIAAEGKTLGLEGALKELAAVVTPEEIKIDLAADVLFDFDKSELKPAAETQLGNLLTVVNSRPAAKVVIEGHTDVRGEAAYNQTLSQRRAESVRTWLTSQGVAESRIVATGAGEARPVKQGETENDHQANRRVEIRIRG